MHKSCVICLPEVREQACGTFSCLVVHVVKTVGWSTAPCCTLNRSSMRKAACNGRKSQFAWFMMQPMLLWCLGASLLLAAPWAAATSTEELQSNQGVHDGQGARALGMFRHRGLLQTGPSCSPVQGYTLFAGQNHVGDQIRVMAGRTAATIAAACSANNQCKGFNTFGLLVSNSSINTVDATACFYQRIPDCQPVSGFLLVKGVAHVGDMLRSMPSQPPSALGPACLSNSQCRGFDFTGLLFSSASANTVDNSSCLYMREPDCPSITGYTLSRDSNHVGDVVQTLAGQTAQQLATACSASSSCAGFNSDGVLVSNATINDVKTSTCFYKRINSTPQGSTGACATISGYVVTSGQNHVGDAVAALPGQLIETLAAACNGNALCAGFSSPYGTLVSIATLNTVDPLACFYTKSTAAVASPSPLPSIFPSPSPPLSSSPSPSSGTGDSTTCTQVTGYSVVSGMDHLGDIVQVLPGFTVDQLATSCTASTTCTGFNNFGVLLSSTVGNVADTSACLYTRTSNTPSGNTTTCAQTAGYTVTTGQNHVGDVISTFPGETVDQLAAACTASATCAGFSSPYGSLVSSATLNTVDALACFYTKAGSTNTTCADVPGFTVTQGQNHLGDALQVLPGSTAQQLAAACAAVSSCVGFNMPYGTLVSDSTLNSVDPMACFYTLNTGGTCPALPGYTIVKGQNHVGDVLQTLSGQTAAQLASVCDANGQCAGFGVPSGNLVSDATLNTVDASACFYKRDAFSTCPVLPGYSRTIGQYHAGDVLQVMSSSSSMSDLAAACSASTTCAGFSSYGTLVTAATLNTNDSLACFYTKGSSSPSGGACTPAAGYTVIAGMNHMGDALVVSVGQTVAQLAASCTSTPTCLGFNSYGTLLTNATADTVDSLACLYTRTASGGAPSSACPTASGYTAFEGQNHAGDTITSVPTSSLDPTTLVTTLKAACDNDRNCRGFNTLGDLKARSSLYAAAGVACFYKRNELVCPPVAGYTVKYGQNHAGSTLVSWGANRTIGQMAAYCDADPNCMAFNNWGFTKSDASINGPDKDICLYTKNCPDVAGYNLLKGQNHAGDDLQQLPGWTMQQLAMSCDSNPKCVAFNSYGHTKSQLYINSLDPQICFYYRSTPRKPQQGEKPKPCSSPACKSSNKPCYSDCNKSGSNKPCNSDCSETKPYDSHTCCSECTQPHYADGMDQWDSSYSYSSYGFSTNVPSSHGCSSCGSSNYPTNPYNSYGW